MSNNTYTYTNINSVPPRSSEGKIQFRCGLCRKYHSELCPAESVDNIKSGKYAQDLTSIPLTANCFEPGRERFKDVGELIEVFTDIIGGEYTLKWFVKGDSDLGLHRWLNGRYVECEEHIKAIVEALAVKCGLREKVRSYIVNEVLGKLKRRSYFELTEEEPKRIAFKNYMLDWDLLLSKDLNHIDKCIIPIEETRDKPVFHMIPHKLDVEYLRKLITQYTLNDGIKTIAEREAPEIVKIFKDWVGDKWPLLFEIIGFCLYPGYPFHKAFMLVGDGSNGKSTYLKLLETILGEENVINEPLQHLCQYPFAPAKLYHKLINIYSDLPSTPLKYTGWFKVLTGEDRVSAERKFKEPITFRNYAKLIFSANQLPEVTDMSYAFWRRWIVVEFPNKFPENPEWFNEHFTEPIIEKLIVYGLIAFINVWFNGGFSIEGEAEDFKEKWLRMENSVYAYVKSGIKEGRIQLLTNGYVDAETLYSDYRDWCDGEDREAEDKATFTKELERLFNVRKRRIREGGRRIYVYAGITLKREGEDLNSETQHRDLNEYIKRE